MDIEFPQILFQMVNFGVVVGALTYLLYKPVKKMLQERSNRIEEAQKAAGVIMAERQSVEDLKQAAKKQAEKEAAVILEKASQDATARKKQLLAEAREESQAELDRLMQVAKSSERAMLKDMESKFAEAVIMTTEKLVGTIDKKSSQKLIDTELKQLIEMI